MATEKGDEDKKKKSITMRASRLESDEESKFEDEDMTMIARKSRKFLKKSNEQKKFRNFKSQKETIICFECKKPGHIKS